MFIENIDSGILYTYLWNSGLF